MPLESPNYVADGDIYPFRFVKASTTPFRVLQATANAPIVGVSQQGTRIINLDLFAVDTKAAIQGEPIRVYGEGAECLVETGGAITAGAYLKSDANGKAVVVATTGAVLQQIGARALDDAASGELVRVVLTSDRSTRPALS